VKSSVLDVLDSIKKDILEAIEKRQEEPRKFDIKEFLEPGVNKGDFSIN